MVFCKYHTVYGSLFCREICPDDTYSHSQTLPFVSPSGMGLPGKEYLVVLVLQLEMLVSELNKAVPNILAESNLFSCNSHPLSGKFSR